MTPESSNLATPQEVMENLTRLGQALARRQNEHEKAASDRQRLTRQWDKRMAFAAVKAKGANAEERKGKAFMLAWEEDEGDLYDKLTEAEAVFAGCQVASRSEETRVGIGQSVLKAQGRG